MARYSKIDRRMWSDEKFRKLSRPQPNAQSLFVYLLTNPNVGPIPGLFSAGEAMLAEAMGWTVEQFRKPFGELLRAGLVRVDLEARFLWLPNAMRYNPPDNPNVVKGWAAAWDELPECQLKVDAWKVMQAVLFVRGDQFADAFVVSCPEPSRKGIANRSANSSANGSINGMPNQEQEQEQEQDQEKQEGDSAQKIATPVVVEDVPRETVRETFYEPDPEFQSQPAPTEQQEDTSSFEELVLSIAKAHPRAHEVVKDGRVASYMQTAILEAAQVEAKEGEHAKTMRDAFTYLLNRTILYRKYTLKWPDAEKRNIANPVRFYDTRTYRQPEAQWERSGPGPGGGRRESVTEIADREGAKAIAELRRRQADARNAAGDTPRQGPRTASELRPVGDLRGALSRFRT